MTQLALFSKSRRSGHQPDFSGRDPGGRDRHPRRRAGPFLAAAVLAVAASYFAIRGADHNIRLGDIRAHTLGLGLSLGLALVVAGVGIVRLSVESGRGPANNSAMPSAGDDAPAEPLARGTEPRSKRNRVGRRRLISTSLLGALAIVPLPALSVLRRLHPAAAADRRRTVWARGVRLLTDPTHRPIRPSDLKVGELVNVIPATLLDLPEDGPARTNERAKAPVALVRMRPEEIAAAKGREGWHVDGILAYSKICTHLGCPVNLYERRTHRVVCPCHQATFDLANNGAVVFGPATRPLPQLPLAVDGDGYLVARSDFTEPVGPNFWERET